MLKKEDLRLYLCTDRLLSMGRPITEAVEQALAGGVTMVQVREKDASTREFYEVALKIQKLTRKYHVPLVVNDRIDIALAIGAEGLHLGQTDMPLGVARRLVGKEMFIGISASTVEEAAEAARGGADYLGVGAVFYTGSKEITGTIGLEGLRAVCGAVEIPTVAIGGVSVQNTREILAAGADGIAVISAILSQPDIKRAAAALSGLTR